MSKINRKCVGINQFHYIGRLGESQVVSRQHGGQALPVRYRGNVQGTDAGDDVVQNNTCSTVVIPANANTSTISKIGSNINSSVIFNKPYMIHGARRHLLVSDIGEGQVVLLEGNIEGIESIIVWRKEGDVAC